MPFIQLKMQTINLGIENPDAEIIRVLKTVRRENCNVLSSFRRDFYWFLKHRNNLLPSYIPNMISRWTSAPRNEESISSGVVCG